METTHAHGDSPHGTHGAWSDVNMESQWHGTRHKEQNSASSISPALILAHQDHESA
jgi:hypothetical protein